MQDAEAPALVWAVRREIELLIDGLPDSDSRGNFQQDLREVRLLEMSVAHAEAML
jgi:hypothetical protein